MNRKEILETDYKELKITDRTKENIKSHSKLNYSLPVREFMGKIYTNEEYESKKQRILNTPLPGDEKGFQKVKSLFRRKK